MWKTINYHCVACDIIFESKSKCEKHLKTEKHKKLSDTNAPYKCDFCNYRTYNKFYKYLHMRNKHKKIKKYSISECKDKINIILEDCKLNCINPNDHFNYFYYASKVEELDKNEFNDFLNELEFMKKKIIN